MILSCALAGVQTNRGGHNSATCQAALVLVVVDQTRELHLANNLANNFANNLASNVANNVADDCRKYTTLAL